MEVNSTSKTAAFFKLEYYKDKNLTTVYNNWSQFEAQYKENPHPKVRVLYFKNEY